MKAFITLKNQIDDGSLQTITSALTSFPTISNVEIDKNKAAVSFQYSNADEALEMKHKLKTLGFSLSNSIFPLFGKSKGIKRFKSKRAIVQ